MLNQFYNYIAEQLVSYWKVNGIPKGNRYFLRLDTREEVEAVVKAIQQLDETLVEPFYYAHEEGEPYETFALNFGETKLVVASTAQNVKTDYLALIRNLVSEQQEGWENTALISIVSEQLDTIPGGSLDVQTEGMPLNAKMIYQHLHDRIQESSLTKSEKFILTDNLDKIMNDYKLMKVSMFDFEEILSTIMKGKIDAEDYKELSMFIDPDLDTFSGKGLTKRIQENRELYEFIKEAHEYNQTEEQLQKKFNPDFTKELLKEGWEETAYTHIQKENKKFEETNKAMKVIYDKCSIEPKAVIWDRAMSDSAAGKRKRQIIVFNPDHEQELALVVKFHLEGSVKTLKQQFVKENDTQIVVKNTTIHVELPTNEKAATFKKVTYKHDGKAALGVELNICVLPVTEEFLAPNISDFSVDVKNQALLVKANTGVVTFGSHYPITQVELKENESFLQTQMDGKTVISIDSNLFEEEEQLQFGLKVDEIVFDVRINNEVKDSIRISGSRIWKDVRESMTDMTWIKEMNRLIHKHNEYYMESKYQEFFEWEYKWLQAGMRAGRLHSGVLLAEDIELSENLREAYSRFVTYFKGNMIPSVCHVSNDYAERAKHYIDTYVQEVEAFQDGVPAGRKAIQLYKLGTIEANETIYITPFHPLMVAYKLMMYEKLGSEEIDSVILSRLTPESLLPFMEKGELYRPQHQDDAPEWLVLKSVNQVTVSDSAHYLSNVITDKMKQFKEHFGYLFTQTSQAPILVNVINLPDDFEVLVGILNFLLHEIRTKGVQSLKSIEVTLYTSMQVNSAFEKFAQLQSLEKVIEYTGLTSIKRIKDVEPDVVLRALRDHLFFYRKYCKPKVDDLRYGHITFYKMHAQESSAMQSMNDMKSDLALNGLYASVPAMRDSETYKTGFGIKNYTVTDDSYLIKTAYYVNELTANARNEGNDSYAKGNTILSRVNATDEATLVDVFEHSHWVTFIDPTVDLEYFKNFKHDLVVIHYSDQYTSSSKFDAITVTNKSDQYYKVIQEFLNNKGIEGTEANIKNTIQAFNTFNGEWLLRIIGTKGYADREKLSIVSAIKYTLAFLDHKNIKWIPISLEEILRVAGVFNLSKKGGIFSAKNLGIQGPTSDDLLLIGLEESDGQLFVHFYPVEVKIGINNNDVVTKAKEQVLQTKRILLDTLTTTFKGMFKEDFYKNFFVQLLIANANKMVQGEIWPEKDYAFDGEVIEKLIKLDFSITDHLQKFIGIGAVVTFTEGKAARANYIDEENIQVIEFSLEDGFNGIVKSMNSVCTWLHEEETDFIKERFLKNRYIDAASMDFESSTAIEVKVEPVVELEHAPAPQIEVETLKEAVEQSSAHVEPIIEAVEEPEVVTHVEETTAYPALNDVRIKLGRVLNSNKEIYWEYGHNELANRHLLISGKSGQGKTYFMQCILLEKSKQGISSIVIDYTEGFLPNQLESDFVEKLGDRLKQRIVYMQKLPINPFARTTRTIGDFELEESNTDIAERIKSVFSAVYTTLGIQQLNTIYDRVLVGLDRYNDKMDLLRLKELLEEDGSSTALKTLSQIRPLIDRNPFTSEETIDWKEVMDRKGDVFVIQLTAYPRDVQLIITEFILWDLWNFSVRHGSKSSPMPVIMDEAQNLDHTEEAPSARVLTEGRKFGWSAWFATQFLKAQMSSSELARLQNATQKIYFAQSEEDIAYIANSLANEFEDRKYWEDKLSNLKKGQCIVQGPQLEANGKLSQPKNVIIDITPLTER